MNVFSIMTLIALVLGVVALSWVLVKYLINYLVSKQIVDVPNERTLHKGHVPRGGGLVIVFIMFLSQIVLAFVSQRYQLFSALALFIFAWASLSWWDDLHDVSARARLAFQCTFTLVALLAFGYISVIDLSSNHFINLSIAGAAISFVGVVWFANLYNFMDGIDGLAASQTIIGTVSMAFWFYYYSDVDLALNCLILAAASYGFLLWNWQPAKVFMGDIGSITIGAFFAILIIIGVTRYQIPALSFVLLFGVFVFDTGVTIARRALKGEAIWQAHRQHFYQRLTLIGVSHATVVIFESILMLICAMLASLTVLDHDRIVSSVFIELGLFLISVSLVIVLEKKHKRISAD